ncbi:migration and invasion inhibitory protein isoform X2 [Brachyhypopomus gauderio]|uniref:migration and invasion inhibitory protein isoform X2 n=1 Tax=Brachyhypopomus gauderio TaxID=698409 RepID=UPI004041C391
MLSFERLETLRNQNKELLTKLKNQTEQLQSLTGATHQTRSGSALVTGSGPAAVSGPDTVVSVPGRRPNRARVALSGLATRVKTTKPTDTTHSSLLQEEGSRPHEHLIDRDQIPSTPTAVSLDSDRRVTFLSPDQELETTYERERVQPLLGYDWIAGLLDAESSLTERSEQFFRDLRSFRQVNKDECIHSGLPISVDAFSSPEEKGPNEPESASDSHQCTFCYRINNRLFAEPLDPQAACPICKMPRAEQPHTERQPAFVRVSIPRLTLLPTYRHKARQRCSSDPVDSLALPSHCLSGWSNSTITPSSQMCRLDLRSCVEPRPTTMAATSALLGNQQGLSVSRASGSGVSDQLLNVSRLAHYRLLSPANTNPP